MKIVFVTSTLTSGGAERVISLLANCLSDRGHIVEIINLNKHIVFYQFSPQVRLVFAEDEVGKSIVKKSLWLRRHINKEKPDIVIPFMEAVYCVTLLSLIGVDIPILSSERIDPRKSPFIRNVLRRLILPLTDWLVVQTEEIKSFYPGFIRKKTSVIYNPVSEKVFSCVPTVRKDVIISVGKMDAQKNQAMLIKAFGRIADKFPSYQLVIYGEGPMRQSLQLIIDNLQLTNRVLLPGRTDQVIDRLNEAKLFCFSSDFEGMSNAIIEAMCVGLPVVTTAVSGTKELIDEGRGGFITEIGNEEMFSTTMERVLSDESAMRKMGEYNKSKAYLFKQDTIVDEWECLISTIIN